MNRHKTTGVRRAVFAALIGLTMAISSGAAEKADTLVIEGRLMEIPGTFPPNDLYNYVYIMKYRVLKVVKGSCSEKEILVGHYNPRIARAAVKDQMDAVVNGTVTKFTVGDKQKLVLVRPLSRLWSQAVEDEYYDVGEEQKYFAIKADIAQ
jgi:hypothetical protein